MRYSLNLYRSFFIILILALFVYLCPICKQLYLYSKPLLTNNDHCV